MARKKERKAHDNIASERMHILFEQARNSAVYDAEKANHLVAMAHKISLRCRTPIPLEYRRAYCRKCLTYYTKESSRHRLNPKNKAVERKCLKCGYTRRYRYKEKS